MMRYRCLNCGKRAMQPYIYHAPHSVDLVYGFDCSACHFHIRGLVVRSYYAFIDSVLVKKMIRRKRYDNE